MAAMDIELHWTKAEQYVAKPHRPNPKATIAAGGDYSDIEARGECSPVTVRSGQQPLYLTLIRLYESFRGSSTRLRDTATKFAAAYGLLITPSTPGAKEPLGVWEGAIEDALKLHKWRKEIPGTVKFGNFDV